MIMGDSDIVQALAQFTEYDPVRHVQLHWDMTRRVLYHGGVGIFLQDTLTFCLPYIFPESVFIPMQGVGSGGVG